MQLRERQYRSRLGSRGISNSRGYSSITNGHQRPPLQVMKTVLKWAPLALAAAVVWFLLDTYVF